MTTPFRKTISYAALFLAGAGLSIYLTPFLTQIVEGKTYTIGTYSEKGSSLAYSCVDTKKADKEIYFVSCGGLY